MDAKLAGLVGFYWLLIFVTLLFLVLRAWVRYFLQRKRPNLSDLFVLLAWLGYTANGVANLMMSILQFEFSSGGSSNDVSVQASPDKLVQVLKLIYGAYTTYPFMVWSTKASILAFYYELFPFNQRKLRLALHVTTGFNIASFTVAEIMSCSYCRPVSLNWSLDPTTQCVNATKLPVFYTFAITNIVCDVASTSTLFRRKLIVVFVLPFFLLREIKVSRRQFWGLCVVFALGGITIVTSIARTVAIAVVADTTQVVVWSILEGGVGIIVACCPALRVLLRKAGETFSSRSRGHESLGTGISKRRSSRHVSDVEADVDEYPLVKVGNQNEIIKQIDFQVRVDSHGPPAKDDNPW